MRASRRQIALRLSCCVLAVTTARAFDLPAGPHLPFGGTAALSRLVAGTALDSLGWQVDLGVARLYDMSELDQLLVSGYYSHSRWNIVPGVAQFGDANLYREQTVKWLAGYRLWRGELLLTASAIRLEFGNNYGSLSGVAAGIGAAGSYRNVRGSFLLDNLNAPRLHPNGEPYPRIFHGRVEWRASNRSTIAGLLRIEGGNTAQLSLGQQIRLQRLSNVGWGFGLEPFQFGGFVDLGIGRIRFGYRAMYHPTLSLSHLVTLSFGTPRTFKDDPDEFTLSTGH